MSDWTSKGAVVLSHFTFYVRTEGGTFVFVFAILTLTASREASPSWHEHQHCCPRPF